jgi:hypothetical protein
LFLEHSVARVIALKTALGGGVFTDDAVIDDVATAMKPTA